MRLLLAALLAVPAPLWAGKLDLETRLPPPLPATAARDPRVLPVDLWRPGSPLYTEGESLGVQAMVHAGNTGLAAAGLAESVGAWHSDKDARPAAVGFGIVTLIQLWSSWRLWKGASRPSQP